MREGTPKLDPRPLPLLPLTGANLTLPVQTAKLGGAEEAISNSIQDKTRVLTKHPVIFD